MGDAPALPMDRAWEIEEVLQAACAGDYSMRCQTGFNTSFADDPFAAIAPAINLLLHDLQTKERKRQKAEKNVHETIVELENKVREISLQNELISKQRQTIKDLSTPVLDIWDDVLALPIVGILDSMRAQEVMERLLDEISRKSASFVILDVTGVDVIDTSTADHLMRMVRAAALVGSNCVLTGIRPAVAQTLVELGVDMSKVITLRTLQQGLRYCLVRHGELRDKRRPRG